MKTSTTGRNDWVRRRPRLVQQCATLATLSVLLQLPAALAQSALPVNQPTRTSAPQQPAAPATAPARHMQVLYSSGVLTIHAENSSLNGILREIARTTGMSITGGVQDERVYGNYGPADTGTVLATLLAGTGSNMLLEESLGDRPLTLVLTPRQGGPTPPSPAQVAPDRDEERNEADLPPQQSRPTPPTGAIQAPPTPQTSAPASVPATTPAAQTSDATTPNAGTTDQQSPNGVKTPQQIYDQLMKLKQQQPATTPQ